MELKIDYICEFDNRHNAFVFNQLFDQRTDNSNDSVEITVTV